MPERFFSQKEQDVLKLALRRKIYELVEKFSGANFHELKRKSKIPTGTLQYHLHYLSKHKVIVTQKDGNKVRFFTKELAVQEKKLLVLLRQKQVRTILLFLVQHKKATQKELISLGLAVSSVSGYMKRLIKAQVVKTKKEEKIVYSLAISENEVMSLLIKYKESFLDKLVDQTIEMWTFRV